MREVEAVEAAVTSEAEAETEVAVEDGAEVAGAGEAGRWFRTEQ